MKSAHVAWQSRLSWIAFNAILNSRLAYSPTPDFGFDPGVLKGALVVELKPVPMESNMSGSFSASSGHKIFRSLLATNTGLLNLIPPSLKVIFVASWKKDLKYVGAADVARSLLKSQ